MQPSISLIVPVRNVQTTLARNIHRVLDVLSEMASRFEILLVDNGSTDQTTDVAYELAREFPQVRVVRYDMPRDTESVVHAAAKNARGEVLVMQSPESTIEPLVIRPAFEVPFVAPTDVELPRHVQGLSINLLERLSRWGNAIACPSKLNKFAVDSGSPLANGTPATLPVDSKPAPRRPQSFLVHLRALASDSASPARP